MYGIYIYSSRNVDNLGNDDNPFPYNELSSFAKNSHYFRSFLGNVIMYQKLNLISNGIEYIFSYRINYRIAIAFINLNVYLFYNKYLHRHTVC